MKKLLVAATVIVGLAALLVIAAVGRLAYDIVSRVDPLCNDPANERQYTPAQFQQAGFDTQPYLIDSYQEVSFPSRDANVTLSAFYIPANDADAPAVIVVHGLSACKRQSSSLVAAGMLNRNGFAILVIDLRDMGDSEIEDGRQSAGTKEYRDVLGAWDWLVTVKGMKPERIGLFGYSLGGASSIIAAGEEPRVAAVWADSAFADIEIIIDDLLIKYGLPQPIKWTALMTGRLMSGDDLTAYKPVEELSKFGDRPLFIVHGDADTMVPVYHATLLKEAAKTANVPAQSWIVAGSRHVESMFDSPLEYEAKLVEFFFQHLSS